MEDHIKIHGIIPRIQYVANGENTTFEFPFAIFKDDNLEVYIDETLQSSNSYTVSGAGNTDGGSITFLSAPAEGSVVTLFRNLSIERTTDFQEGGALRANALNYELDYQIACQQQIADNMNRSMTFPPYATNIDVDLTLPTPSAGKAIVWNADGTNLENSTVAVNVLEDTLRGYKESAETAADTATTKAGIASDKADIATAKAQIATEKAAEATTTLANKANKDMDNLSATGKANITNLNAPDSSSAVSVTTTVNETFTCPHDGYLYLACYGFNGSAFLSYQSSVADYRTNVYCCFVPSSNTGVQTTMYAVKNGEVLTCSNSAGYSKQATFIPCIGG